MAGSVAQLRTTTTSAASLSSVRRPAPIGCSSSQFLGNSVKAPSSTHRAACRGRRSLWVQANELNQWANRDAFDDGNGEEDDGFHRDTALLVLRMMTARSTQRLILSLQEVDLYAVQWLSEFCSVNKPMEGNKFLLKMMRERPVKVVDKFNGTEHNISPPDLAHRILKVREDMAAAVVKGFPEFVSRDNIEVLRKHLTMISYTSGSYEESKKRRYRR